MAAPDCIFCKIAARQIPAQLVHQDDACVAFRDLNPQAPTHILVIPKKHVDALDEFPEGDKNILGHLVFTAKEIAKKEGLFKNGYRVVINSGPNAGQTVFHLHLHVMGGRSFSWPPG